MWIKVIISTTKGEKEIFKNKGKRIVDNIINTIIIIINLLKERGG